MTDRSTVRHAVARRDVQALVALTLAELLLLAAYLAVTPAELTRVRYALYPFVWINVGLWAVLHVRIPSASRRRRSLAAAVAGLYLLVLLVLAGLVGIHPQGTPEALLGVTVGYGTPGWERVRLVTPAVHLTLVPFRLVGYAALAVLVYVTVLDAAAAAVSGAVGFASCVSCSFPVLASLASGLFGGSAVLTGLVYGYALDISTAVFLLAIALLYYRPGFRSRSGSQEAAEATQRME